MSHGDLFQKLADDAKTRIKEISTEEFVKDTHNQPPILIDVREESEWEAGHAEGAVHLSRGIIEQKIQAVAPDPETPIVCYCGGGNRSALVADSLQKLGYTNVQSLAGGFKAWQETGLPIAKDDSDQAN